jgi:site-specific DNA-methyltransferase (adenine-specific)/site-specific DNA-methyltransferase (cytosine-N4-specific)
MKNGLAALDALVDTVLAYHPPTTKKKPKPKIQNVQVIQGDCAIELRRLPSDSIDLVVTSPPYADQRVKTYGGITPDRYVEWFLPIADELHRVLKPTGSFVLNIKERVVNGERHTYVMELILAMRKRGWLWTEEYVWHKKNCYPGKWPNRFRDAWERCLHFTKQRKFAMYQDAVRVPMGDWNKSRLKNLSATDKRRDESKVGSGFGKKIENWIGRDLAYPPNVLHLATECANRNHSAAFPEAIPEWFIKLFSKEGDLVLDPFMGSGTTLRMAMRLKRRSIGIELLPEYCKRVSKELDAVTQELSGEQKANGTSKPSGRDGTLDWRKIVQATSKPRK